VVVRPEDVEIRKDQSKAEFFGTVSSCTFKGVFYQIFVNTETGFELMVQNYRKYDVGEKVGMQIQPGNIQVMRKPRIRNTFNGEIIDNTHVCFLGESFECKPTELKAGTEVKVEVEFKNIDLQDHQEEGTVNGEVHFILYKGDHYHLTVLTESGEHVYVDTQDIWDKGDLVGINIAARDIKIGKIDE
ncbi:MAG: TOBE domain-containing protein, partial [Bacteroidales bacterium]|nr:TOBE domain-containing protein [Candidatus Cacconaster merdequi]